MRLAERLRVGADGKGHLMNVLVLSGRAHIVPAVLALVQLRVAAPNLFRVASYDQLFRVLSYAQCDLVVLDSQLTGRGFRQEEAELRDQFPDLAIITLDAGEANFALPPGQSMLSQATPTDQLLRAIRLVSPAAEHVVAATRTEPALPDTLTTRQRDVLNLLRQGCRTREIAAILGLAVPTVKSHLRALYRHLGASNRLEAVIKSEPLIPARPALRVVC